MKKIMTQQNSPREQKSKPQQCSLASKSRQYYISKFTKELIKLWQGMPRDILDETNLANETMSL